MQEWEHGWFLDNSLLVDASYTHFRLKPGTFDLEAPYFSLSDRTKERKGNVGGTARLDPLSSWITSVYTQEVKEAFCSFIGPTTLIPETLLVKRKGKIEEQPSAPLLLPLNLTAWCNMVTKMKEKFGSVPYAEECFPRVLLKDAESQTNEVQNPEVVHHVIPENELFDIIYENNEEERIISVQEHQFIIPGQTCFLMSDFSNLLPLQANAKVNPFQYIIMDPPWENKSAERKKNYKTFYMKKLFQLPINDLLPKGDEFAVVVIWITNNPKIKSFVVSKLLPRWNLVHATTWHWLKCTSNGSPVFPPVKNRKPNESMIIAVRNPAGLALPEALTSPRLLVAVPSKMQHSRKPSIDRILDSITKTALLPSTAKIGKLELFARNLQKGWFSWGNEAILHQNSSNYTRREETALNLPQ